MYDAESQGKFYLAVDTDEFHLLVGNFPVTYTDTELAAYQRTLFGGQAVYRSVSKTKYGQPDTLVAVFGAEVRQAHISDRLQATGGSLYYLSHQNVIEGNEQVTLEVRDKDTGLILSRLPQQQNVDYTVKYEEGRILFHRPISSVLESGTLIDRDILSGNPVFIQVDYETVLESFEKTAFGGRVRKQIGDHVGIGGTYVNDQLQSGEYELQRVDAELRAGKNTRFLAEYAESSGAGSQKFQSEDGGLTFTEEATTGSRRGRGWKVAAEVDAGEWFGKADRIRVGGYLKRLEPGFYSSGNTSEAGSEKYGGNVKLKITDRDTFFGRYDWETFDGSSLSAASQVETGTAQFDHNHGRWGITGELQTRESSGGGNASERTTLGAARLRFSPLEKLTARLEQQLTVEGPKNDQTTLGAQYQAHPKIALEATGTTGTQGESAQGGAIFNLGNGRVYVREKVADDQAGRSTSTILGSETEVAPGGKVYTEYQWGRADNGDTNLALLGTRWQRDLRKGLRLLLAGEYSKIDSDPQDTSRYTLSAGLSFAHPTGIKAETRNEVRREEGNNKRTQILTTNLLEVKLTPDFTFLGKYRYSRTNNETLGVTEARFEERSVGLAYRPTARDRFNALAKYTQLWDQRPVNPADNTASGRIRDVVSIDWSLELNRHFEWVFKEAVKFGKDKLEGGDAFHSRSYLTINRLNVHLWKPIDLGIEYRILRQVETDTTRQGWLGELMWKVLDNMKVGVGYNFTDFSDNEFSENDYSVHGWFVRVQGTY